MNERKLLRIRHTWFTSNFNSDEEQLNPLSYESNTGLFLFTVRIKNDRSRDRAFPQVSFGRIVDKSRDASPCRKRP